MCFFAVSFCWSPEEIDPVYLLQNRTHTDIPAIDMCVCLCVWYWCCSCSACFFYCQLLFFCIRIIDSLSYHYVQRLVLWFSLSDSLTAGGCFFQLNRSLFLSLIGNVSMLCALHQHTYDFFALLLTGLDKSVVQLQFPHNVRSFAMPLIHICTLYIWIPIPIPFRFIHIYTHRETRCMYLLISFRFEKKRCLNKCDFFYDLFSPEKNGKPISTIRWYYIQCLF